MFCKDEIRTMPTILRQTESAPEQSEPHLLAQPLTTEIEHKEIDGQEEECSQTALGLAQQRDNDKQAHQSQHQRQGKRITDRLPGSAVADQDADRFAHLVSGTLAIGHNDLLRAVLT